MKIRAISFLFPLLLINLMSLITLHSISTHLLISQGIKLSIALAAFYIVYLSARNTWITLAKIIYIGAIALLIFNLFHFSQIKRWINIGGIFIQFSEFAKIALILMLSKFLSQNTINFKNFCIASGIILLPAFLIFKQPNLGTALIFLGVGFGMLWIKGINGRVTIFSLLAMGCASPFVWHKMLPYQKSRILAFLHPSADPRGSSYQTIQSVIAIGAGGIFGSDGLQNKLGFVPENHTDFLFSYFAEKYGFIASLILICTILYALLRLFQYIDWNSHYTNTSNANTQFTRFFIIGFILLWFIEAAMNIGMNLGILPITGIALPGFSFGGSALISFFIAYGIILNLLQNKVR